MSTEKMGRMRAAWALTTVTLLAGCAGVPRRSGGTPEAVSFETILHEATSGLHERRREVIRDEASWARLWARIHEGVTPPPALPSVDFSREMLIAVATGTRPSGGFAIRIRDVTRSAQRLDVVVVETCPAAGERVSMGLTQPVEIVRLERLAQSLTLRESRTATCR